jgi:hypothetical protein
MASGDEMPKLEISKVHDAYAAPGECPLCVLLRDAEAVYLASFQHSRVMEPNVRVQTNSDGFCPDHARKLYVGENKLGLALVLHTHLQAQLPALRALFTAAAEPGRRGRDPAAEAGSEIDALVRRCFLCGLLEGDRERYAFTILYLWDRDEDFRRAYATSRGFCLPHFADLAVASRDHLRGERREEWLRQTGDLMTASLETAERDLLAFTQLFRDTAAGPGAEEARTALSRTLQKLSGGIFRLT